MSEQELIARVGEVRDWMLDHAESGAHARDVAAHLAGFDDDEKIRGWVALYESSVIPVIGSVDGTTGVDFGCWTGLGSWILSMLGPRRVIGVEINPSTAMFAERWTKQFGLESVHFVWNAGGIVPLPSRSVDWVYVNQVFCNMRPDGFEVATAEIARILRPGGRLVFCDSNNPHCPATLERLERVYRQREIGEGSEQRPGGVLHVVRREHIASMLRVGPASAAAERLARNTCYMGGPELEQAVRAYVSAGVAPASPFVGGWERAPVNPITGMAAGNVTDPFWFAGRFESLGLEVSINTSASQGPSDPLAVYELLKVSQGFYVIGTKR
ncbi:MAG: class I SAM-dependent methyltransferase [Phycisphaerales bacterium]|nr:class I SAM-dependent methyltransferase [Phycisphaerales bacterium]